MDPEASKHGPSQTHKNKVLPNIKNKSINEPKPKWIRKRVNFWIKQGKSVEEAEKLSVTPLQQLKKPAAKALLAAKNKMNKTQVSPANTQIKSTRDAPSKQFKPQPHSTPGSIRVGLCAERPIRHDDAKLVMKEVGRLIDIYPGDLSPRFVRSSLKAGVIMMTCVDQETRDWLESQVALLKPWPGAQFRLVEDTEIPKSFIGIAWIIDEDLEPKTILTRLHRQNRTLGCLHWKVLNVKKQIKGQTVAFSFDETSLNALRENNFQVFLTTELIKIRVKNYKPKVEEATTVCKKSETRNIYEPLISKSEQSFSNPSNYDSPILDNEDLYGGPSGASADYSTINKNEEESNDWSSTSSMSAENEEYWQQELPDDPCEARRSEFINDQAERWPSPGAELNMDLTHYFTQGESQTSRQYGSVSLRDSYRSDLQSGHGERYMGLSTEDHQRSSTASNRELERYTSSHSQNDWQYSSGKTHDSHYSSHRKYEDWTRSSACPSREMRNDFSSRDILWEPRSAFASSSAHGVSSPNGDGSRSGNSRGIKRPYLTTGSGYSRGNSAKRGRSSYNPYQRH